MKPLFNEIWLKKYDKINGHLHEHFRVTMVAVSNNIHDPISRLIRWDIVRIVWASMADKIDNKL
jgi:hypothetical protein